MDVLTITIPASPEYVGVVRLVVSGLASRVGFTIDDIEDLKIAVDELTAYLTGPQGRDGTLRIRFGVDDARIEIEGAATLSDHQKVRSELTQLSRMILDTVVDDASLVHDGGQPRFTLVKTRGA
ncbi:MAG TPA: hypothetical protein VHJ34_15230 [Actinomycetota bacterium]|nr:hypothetical protein [Actinomycetota bacterium]